jgi:hypothetical protein
MNLERMRPVDYFFFGRGVHYALAAYYKDGEKPADAFQDWYLRELAVVRAQTGGLFEAEEQQFSGNLTLGIGMLDHYLLWAQTADKDLTVLDTEIESVLPLIAASGRKSGWYTFGFRLDAIARDTTGALWVMEHKTASPFTFSRNQLYNMERRLENDEQATAYIYALGRMYPEERIAGALFTYLKKAVPEPPRLVHGGTALSKNKQQDTTLELYVSAIKEHGFDPVPYYTFLQHLRSEGNTFFKRFEVKRHPKQLVQFEKDLYRTVKDFSGVRTLNDAYPNPPWYGCQKCTVRALCEIVSLGMDPTFLINTDYRPRRQWREDIQKEEETV